MPALTPLPPPGIQRRWKNLPGEPVGDAGDPYTGYDRFGRTERMRWGKLGDEGAFSPLVDVSWGYDRASQKTWRKDLLAPANTGQDQHFGYDGLYQITERQQGLLNVNTTAVGGIPAQVENFNYDETGNWVSYRQQNDGTLSIDETRVNNRSNQMTQVDGSSVGVSYDKNGNMLSVPTGDGLTGSSRKLVWDAWNRLRTVSDASDTLIADYEYDGRTRRTTTESGAVTRHFYYDDQWRSVEERLDAATTAENQHVWHPADRWELIFRDRSTADDGTIDERLYSLKDQLDPVAICDTTGTVVERYSYTAFGMPTVLNADFTPKEGNTSGFNWQFRFHAEFEDAETGWFNYGYRYYAPTLGRWLSRDPIGELRSFNAYAMIRNNVTNTNDVLGLSDPVTIMFFTRTAPATIAGSGSSVAAGGGGLGLAGAGGTAGVGLAMEAVGLSWLVNKLGDVMNARTRGMHRLPLPGMPPLPGQTPITRSCSDARFKELNEDKNRKCKGDSFSCKNPPRCLKQSELNDWAQDRIDKASDCKAAREALRNECFQNDPPNSPSSVNHQGEIDNLNKAIQRCQNLIK